MKILLDATAVHPAVGGLETYLQGLLGAWRELAPEDEFVSLTSGDAPAAVQAACAALGPVRRCGRGGIASRILAQQVALPYLAKQQAPDVLFAGTPAAPLVPTGVPTVAVVHDLRYLSRPDEFGRLQAGYRRLVYSQAYRRCRRLISISEATREKLALHYPEAAAKTVVVHHGGDHVDSWPRLARAKQALAFGHWSNKRPDLALRVWAALRDQIKGFDWTLHVVGTGGALAHELRGRAQEMQLSDLIHVHPFLPAEAFQALFAACRLVLFPTSEEGFGLPILEAMRLGIPVVTSDLPATREVGGDAPLYAESNREAEFAEHCRRLITDSRLRSQLTEAGLARSAAFTWQRAARRTRDALQAAVSQGRTAGRASPDAPQQRTAA